MRQVTALLLVKKRFDRIKGGISQIVLAVEMEGAAIAQATHSIGLPFYGYFGQ